MPPPSDGSCHVGMRIDESKNVVLEIARATCDAKKIIIIRGTILLCSEQLADRAQASHEASATLYESSQMTVPRYVTSSDEYQVRTKGWGAASSAPWKALSGD